ncbi:hypothetical protein [Streptomyces sp. NPDC018321]|uniref:hypothetical protein n=1 Tax=unclassified Streptomyces TaxID=2593676 RepID=UPI00379A45DF
MTTRSFVGVRQRNGPAAALLGKGHLMTGLRSTFVTAVAAALFALPVAAGTAAADDGDDAPVMEPGCAKLDDYGYGWADIYNACGHTISASVEVDGWDPDCIQIAPYSVGTIGLEPGDEPYYAYEC